MSRKPRLNASYFSFATTTKLEELHPDLNRKCASDFSEFYQRALKYISEQRFQARISKLNLESVATFAEFSAAVRYCGLESVNRDELYEVFGSKEEANFSLSEYEGGRSVLATV